MAKLKWVELNGMKYVEDYETDYNHCARCAFEDDDFNVYCKQVNCRAFVYIPLEPQHIPNLRKVGKTKWLS